MACSSSLADFFESKIEALSSDDDICCIVYPDGQGGYGAVNTSNKIVLSIKNEDGEDTYYVIKKKLILNVIDIIKNFFEGDEYEDADSVIPLINVNNPQCFKKLIVLLDAYNKNPQAYEKGQRFEMSIDTVCTNHLRTKILPKFKEKDGAVSLKYPQLD